MQATNSIIKMENITKTFPGVKALDRVSIDVRPGEVHTLVGENGAGKSTLMKIIAGVYPQDAGQYFFEGSEVFFTCPRDAQSKGLSIIYQEFNLVPSLSIQENIFLGREPVGRLGKIDWKKMYTDTKGLLEELGVNLDPKEKIINLSVANQQMVEIAKALSFNAKAIIMDEPTAVLEDDETEELFKIIESLKRRDVGIFYISHKMDEIFKISDRITVLRDGQHIATKEVAETNIDEIIRLMVGREIRTLFPEREHRFGEATLEVRNLSVPGKFQDVSFELRKGEVLGIAGLMGCGKIDIGKAVFGYYPQYRGRIYLRGQEVRVSSPEKAIENGIALVSEDRKNGGLVLVRDVKENITLASLRKLVRMGSLDHHKEEEVVEAAIGNLGIKVFGPEQPVSTLSGGNQQKVVLAKWLETEPEIIILLEPTRGIDIGSKAEIYDLVNDLAKRGISLLYISSELPELIGLCDRVVVIHEGRQNGEVSGDKMTQEEIMFYSSGRKKNVG